MFYISEIFMGSDLRLMREDTHHGVGDVSSLHPIYKYDFIQNFLDQSSKIKSMPSEIILFPEFSDVFNEVDELAKCVFFPLLTIRLSGNPEIGDKKFHIVSIWDNGSHKKNYFNNYRPDVFWIKFDYINGKYSYNAPIDFPSIQYLKGSYEIAKNHFEKNIDFYLTSKSYIDFSETQDNRMGGIEIRKEFPDMNEFDSEYYFGRVISYLLTKERYKRFKVLNSKMTFSMRNYKGQTEEYVKENFNSFGNTDFLRFLEMPEHLKYVLEPNWGRFEDQVFIAAVDSGDFIISDSTLINLFYDKKLKQVVQQFEWD